jgi:hypothetical protein
MFVQGNWDSSLGIRASRTSHQLNEEVIECRKLAAQKGPARSYADAYQLCNFPYYYYSQGIYWQRIYFSNWQDDGVANKVSDKFCHIQEI